ncbi:MAG: gliding motility-associated protein GldE [Crocinitomicaceae bacterium]|nr:gliding motility-associated protein GldE [Crocinitomicaceae bacterium]MDG1776429.1 gliding motility-associated protein GldE [Crocinitomicaceae bacterium]
MNFTEPPSTMPFDGAIKAGFETMDIIFIFILIALLILSALISGSEAAFFSLNPTDKDALKNDTSKKAGYVKELLNKPKHLLATILITNNFVNVGVVILSSAILSKTLDNPEANNIFNFFIEVIVITLTLLLIGEVIPKIYATKNALGFSNFMARPLHLLNRTPPLSWMRLGLVSGSQFIQNKIGKRKINISSDELEQAIALTKEINQDNDDHKILQGIVKFGNTEVRQIMKPRVDVHAIESKTPFDQALDIILDCGHSRIPVYKDNFDEIVGILFIKDLLPILGTTKDYNWLSLIRKPFYVPENKKIDDLLKEFQEMKVHIALVVDEYGGTSGLVSLEDILEEIVGDITDEFDDDKIAYTKINNNSYLFEGKTTIIDFLKVLEIDEQDFDFETKNAETLGGYIIEHAGRILEKDASIEIGNVKLVIESSDNRRIKMIKAIKRNNSDEIN